MFDMYTDTDGTFCPLLAFISSAVLHIFWKLTDMEQQSIITSRGKVGGAL